MNLNVGEKNKNAAFSSNQNPKNETNQDNATSALKLVIKIDHQIGSTNIFRSIITVFLFGYCLSGCNYTSIIHR